jgi:hypothetical protein
MNSKIVNRIRANRDPVKHEKIREGMIKESVKYDNMTLNQKIFAVINKHSDVTDTVDLEAVVDDFSFQDLANELETLLLQSQVDLLNQIDLMGSMIVVGEGDTVMPLKNKISELTLQIQKLKQ